VTPVGTGGPHFVSFENRHPAEVPRPFDYTQGRLFAVFEGGTRESRDKSHPYGFLGESGTDRGHCPKNYEIPLFGTSRKMGPE